MVSCSKALAGFGVQFDLSRYRRWGIAPRPENVTGPRLRSGRAKHSVRACNGEETMTATETPNEKRLMAALEATWPPAEIVETDGFRLRRGAGGGKRVSAAARMSPGPDGLDAAVAAMAGWGQGPLFQLTGDDTELDADLARRGYAIADPTLLYVAPATDLIGDGPVQTAHARKIVPALMAEIWAEGGIGPSRLNVMARATVPSVRLLGRSGDRPSGAAFVAVDGDIAMIHAIEVRPAQRRKGVARQLMHAGARFAVANGAHWLALAVTEANGPARALYQGLGMTLAGRYHYRVSKEP